MKDDDDEQGNKIYKAGSVSTKKCKAKKPVNFLGLVKRTLSSGGPHFYLL
jgi:hypothetical protein